MTHPAISKFVKLGLDRETAEALVKEGVFTPRQAREHPGLVEAAGVKAMTVLRVVQKVTETEGEAREVAPAPVEIDYDVTIEELPELEAVETEALVDVVFDKPARKRSKKK